MGVNSVASVSRTPPSGTSTCYGLMVTVQERARRNSGLRSLLRDNLFMNLSSHGKWRLPEIVDDYDHVIHASCFLFSHTRYLSSFSLFHNSEWALA